MHLQINTVKYYADQELFWEATGCHDRHITAFSITSLSIKDTQHYDILHKALCITSVSMAIKINTTLGTLADRLLCRVSLILGVIMLDVIMLGVIMLGVILLSVAYAQCHSC